MEDRQLDKYPGSIVETAERWAYVRINSFTSPSAMGCTTIILTSDQFSLTLSVVTSFLCSVFRRDIWPWYPSLYDISCYQRVFVSVGKISVKPLGAIPCRKLLDVSGQGVCAAAYSFWTGLKRVSGLRCVQYTLLRIWVDRVTGGRCSHVGGISAKSAPVDMSSS